jgi:hypothetical protein
LRSCLKEKSCGSGLENRKYRRRDTSRRPRDTLYPQKLALTSPTSGGRSVCIRSRTLATEFFSFFLITTFHCRAMYFYDSAATSFQIHSLSSFTLIQRQPIHSLGQALCRDKSCPERKSISIPQDVLCCNGLYSSVINLP